MHIEKKKKKPNQLVISNRTLFQEQRDLDDDQKIKKTKQQTSVIQVLILCYLLSFILTKLLL